MKRRQFSTFIATSAFASSAVRAQQASRTYRVTMLVYSERGSITEVVLAGLQSMGYIDRKNLTFDQVGVGLAEDQMVDAVRKVIAAGTDLLMAGGPSFIKAAMAATSTIPIVGLTNDMVGEGHVGSLARPGGNVTGISILSIELDGKRQEILIEAMPTTRRIAVLADLGAQVPAHYENLRAAARARWNTVELSLRRAGDAQQIEAVLTQAREQGDEAVNVLSSPVLFAHRQALFETLKALRLPAIYQ
jgi:putative tryptophan/tyrosine transport system substrate-binding protein